MQRYFIIPILFRWIVVFAVIGLFCFSASGCLIIGAKDGDVRDRVSKLESRLDSLECQYATLSSPRQNEHEEGFAASNQVADSHVTNKVTPKSRSLR